MKRARPAIAAFASLALVAATTADGSAAQYLSIPGVTGPVTATGYKGDLDIDTYSIGVTALPNGSKSLQALQITKPIDSSSPRLLQIFTSGKPVPGTTMLYVLKTGTPSVLLASIALQNVLITSDSGSGGGSGGETETLTLTYDSIKYCATNESNPKAAQICTAEEQIRR
jgi:type VI protein secretion system component Hcp